MALIADKLRAVMAIDPARVEIDFAGREFSWGKLASAVAEIEALLGSLGLPADARVGIMLRNRPGHVAAVVAVLASERCLVSLNPALPDEALLADVAGLDLAVLILDETELARPGLAEGLSGGLAACLTDTGTAALVVGPCLEGARLLAPGERAPGGATGITSSTAPGIAIEMLTSGTTGAPKRVPLTREAFGASLVGFTRYERGREFADKARLRSGVTMVVNPLSHIGGIFGCIGALVGGRKLCLLEKFTVEGWVAAVRRNRPRVAPAVPSAVRMLLDAEVDPADLASLTALTSGTAPLAPDLVDAFHAKYGVPILANYGATEFAGAVAGWGIDDFRSHWQAKRGAAGRIHANIAARVVDPATGAVLPHGTEGLLELKGDQLGPAHSMAGDRWLRTADRAVLDADRFLFIRGRADNAIIRGGFKVQPEDVGRVLGQHPAIREVVVVGLPDTRLGAVPAAAIVLKRGAPQPDPEGLSQWLRSRLLPYQIPTRFLFLDDLPRTPSLKPSNPEITKLFAQSTEAEPQ